MSLKVWLPLNNSIHNQGLLGDFTVGTSPTYVDGKIGKALSGGSLSMTAEQTNSVLNNNAFSICFWIYPNQASGTSHSTALFGNDGMTAPNNRRFWLYHYPTCNLLHLSWQNYDSNNAALSYVSTTDLMPSYTWTHVAVTYNKTDKKVIIYKNGEVFYTYTNAPVFTSPNYSFATTLMKNDSTRYLNDYRVYDHCLTPQEVKEISKGLVAHYTLGNASVYEATTNNYNGMLGPINCYNGSNSKYGFNNDTDFHYTDGIFLGRYCRKVYEGSLRTTNNFYPEFGYIHPQTNGAYKTISFDLYPTQGTSITFYTYNGSGTVTSVSNGVGGYGASVPIITNLWNHLEVTIKSTSSATSGYDYAVLGEHTANNNYWLFANVQVEDKDHATPYTPSSRSTGLVYDSSGYSRNLTIAGNVSPADSVRYDKALLIGTSTLSGNVGNISAPYTWSFWMKAESTENFTTNYYVLKWGDMFIYRDHNSTYQYSLLSAGTLPIERTQWNHIVIVDNGSTIKAYVNGSESISRSHSTTIGNFSLSGYTDLKVSDLRLYATALSADDVKDLYNLGTSIS